MRFGSIAAALALLGAAFALAGCGVSKEIDPVAAAATKSVNAGGEKVTLDVQLSGLPGAQSSADITGSGIFDQQQGEMTLDLASVLPPAGSAASDGDVDMRFLTENGDPVIYMNIPFLSRLIPGGKPWLRIDVEQAGKSLGVDFSKLMNQAEQNPAQELELLEASGNVTKVGPATIDGVATTEYGGTVDLAKAAKVEGVTGSDRIVEQLTKAGVSTHFPVKVWVDGNGMVRQFTSDEQASAAGNQIDTSVTVDISDYGVPVTVTAPPADQVTDLTGLISKAGAGLGKS